MEDWTTQYSCLFWNSGAERSQQQIKGILSQITLPLSCHKLLFPLHPQKSRAFLSLLLLWHPSVLHFSFSRTISHGLTKGCWESWPFMIFLISHLSASHHVTPVVLLKVSDFDHPIFTPKLSTQIGIFRFAATIISLLSSRQLFSLTMWFKPKSTSWLNEALHCHCPENSAF